MNDAMTDKLSTKNIVQTLKHSLDACDTSYATSAKTKECLKAN